MTTNNPSNSSQMALGSEKCKLTIVGNSSVGKTSFLTRFIDGVWNDAEPTIGVNFRQLTLNIDNKLVKTSIYDLSGNDAFRSMNCQYFKDCDGIFFVYDVSDKESFQNLEHWLKNSRTFHAKKDAFKFLVANKVDLPEKQHVVKEQDAKKFAASNGMRFYSASAKTGLAAKNPIRDMVNAIFKDELGPETSELETECSTQTLQSEERFIDHEEMQQSTEIQHKFDEEKIEEPAPPKVKKKSKSDPGKKGLKSIFSNLFCKSSSSSRKNAYLAGKPGSNQAGQYITSRIFIANF